MPFKLRLARTLRRWHARIGFAALIFFVLIAATGVALNHGAALGLDSRYVHAEWIARWYGIRQEQPRQAYRTASHLLVAANGRWLLDGSPTGEKMPHPLGLVEIGELLVVGGESSLHVYRADGALVDRLDGYALPGVPLKAIGAGDGELVVQTAGGPFSSADVLSWRPGAPKVVAWSMPTPLAASDREAYARRLAPGIPLQRILLDLHSGRFLGSLGPLFFDLVAIFLALLALTGAWMFLAPRLRR
jgi:PepSY-associated transmembrane protein